MDDTNDDESQMGAAQEMSNADSPSSQAANQPDNLGSPPGLAYETEAARETGPEQVQDWKQKQGNSQPLATDIDRGLKPSPSEEPKSAMEERSAPTSASTSEVTKPGISANGSSDAQPSGEPGNLTQKADSTVSDPKMVGSANQSETADNEATGPESQPRLAEVADALAFEEPDPGPGTVDPNLKGTDDEKSRSEASIFHLSPLLANVCYHLAKTLHLSPFCVLPECLVVAGAMLRNRVKLRTGLSPHPVNGAMHAVFCDDGTGRLARVLEFLMAWMTEIQDTKFSQVTESTRRIIRRRVERLERWNAEHEFSPENPDSRIPELERRLKSARLVNNPNPGELVGAIRESADNALTVVLDECAFAQILNTAKTKSADDLRLLRDGWSGTTMRLTNSQHKHTQPIVRPAVSAIVDCRREVLARLLTATEAPLTQIAEQVITMAASGQFLQDPVSSPRALEDWQAALASLSTLGEECGVDLVLELARDAELALGEYRDKKIGESVAASPEAQRFAKNAPILAAKIALILQLLVDPGSREVSGVVMRHAIALAEWLSTTTAGFAHTFAADQAKAALIAEAKKMYQKLLGQGRISRWTLFRKFDDQKKDRLEPTLRYLVETGLVVRYDDDTLQTLEESQAN